MADLEESIRVARKAVNATPEGQPRRAKYLNTLGIQLGARYSRTGSMTDLEDSIRAAREAVNATPEDHPDRAKYLNTLGLLLNDRYSRTGSMTDLEESIQVAREAVNATPENHPDRAGRLSNLGVQLHARFSSTGVMADLERSIRAAQEAVNAIPEDHPDQAKCLNNLGLWLGARYSRTGSMTDLEASIRVAEEAVNATPEDHPDRANYLNNLGHGLGNRYSRTGAITDLEDAISYQYSALCQLTSSTTVRIQAGRAALRYCAIISDWQRAYEASHIAVHLIPRLAPRSLKHSDKQYLLALAVGLASDAAAAALLAEKEPSLALDFLEQGRGVIASSLEETRTDILELRDKYPELAEQFERLRNDLEAPVSREQSFVGEHQQSWQVQASRRYEAGNLFDELIVEIRQKPGFEDFLLAPTGEDMQAAAKYGPIVVINVSKYRCDAILIEQHRIRRLDLPNLNSEEIKKKEQEDHLTSPKVLEWLWDVVLSPILGALGFNQPPSDDDWPHVWWIPTGALTRFPLHAAGRHAKGSTETVIDRVMSSYSSSVKAIIHGRRRPLTQAPSAQALLVAMEQTSGHSSLPFATQEVAMLHSLCKSMKFNPIEPERRKQKILSHLPQCSIFHFSGHGHSDHHDPSKSHLLLEDGKDDPLTVANLLETNIREHSPFLAYLSACGTGQIRDERFVDESIHLISACQLAGFRHVIGTLWEVNDETCVDMARVTYEGMRDGGMTDESVCRGLHNATRALRDRWLNMPAKVRRGRGSTRKADMSMIRDMAESLSTCDENQRNGRLPRDVVLCDDDDYHNEERYGPLHWVPYVHFGV
ncbi:hypothetical protein CNMCM6106_008626 [Aspergillus hiratsukae]|uniref:CHAT domain-containing protein n=1 Tax=Aspergillus hiratsukae TaxID=1194566 RepID=A0A8H6QJP6_9EURO|nr:hypothetical protein CNMCM6106_008626 [Aspergillus hiratsukae]